MANKPLVVVAMSGGVDSSVAAWLLAQQGYPLIGMMLKLWNEEGAEAVNRCCTPDSMRTAERVASHIGFPFYVIDVKDPFHQQIVQFFIDGYSQGITPNPCFQCNRLIRWGFLLKTALAFGAQYIATGHYARVIADENGSRLLLKGVDSTKDQSYILSGLNQEQLSHTLLPLGEYIKGDVREIARRERIASANRPESQDLCFLGNGDYRTFLRRNSQIVQKAGPIITREGAIIGEHQGLAFYTIGQRKGLYLNTSVPFYVLDKEYHTNTLIVGMENELGYTQLTAHSVNWIDGTGVKEPFKAKIKIRYKANEVESLVTPLENNRVKIDVVTKLRDITPGQIVVIYQGDQCLGGGIIEKGFNPVDLGGDQ